MNSVGLRRICVESFDTVYPKQEGEMPTKKRGPLMAVNCPECGYEVCMTLEDLKREGTPLCPCTPDGVKMAIDGQGPCDNQGPDGRCLGHGRPGGSN